MITLESYVNEGIDAQVFVIRIPRSDLINLSMDEFELIGRANEVFPDPFLKLEVLLMLLRKIKEREDVIANLKEKNDG